MMNTKGDSSFTLNKVVGIIIAVLGLVLFGFAIMKLYQINVNQDFQNAKKTLDKIIKRIDALEDGQSINISLQGFKEAEKYYLVGWSSNVSLENKPEKCFSGTYKGDSCLCVCLEPNKESCQKKGYCRDVKKSILIVKTEKFGYNPPQSYSYFELSKNCIIFSNTLFEIEINKFRNELVLIDRNEPEISKKDKYFKCIGDVVFL